MNLLIIVVAFGFIAISRSILIASGKAPPPKPMSKKDRWTLYAIILFCVLCYIAGLIFDAISKGMIDPDFLF